MEGGVGKNFKHDRARLTTIRLDYSGGNAAMYAPLGRGVAGEPAFASGAAAERRGYIAASRHRPPGQVIEEIQRFELV
jgi:hypothetical protein